MYILNDRGIQELGDFVKAHGRPEVVQRWDTSPGFMAWVDDAERSADASAGDHVVVEMSAGLAKVGTPVTLALRRDEHFYNDEKAGS